MIRRAGAPDEKTLVRRCWRRRNRHKRPAARTSTKKPVAKKAVARKAVAKKAVAKKAAAKVSERPAARVSARPSARSKAPFAQKRPNALVVVLVDVSGSSGGGRSRLKVDVAAIEQMLARSYEQSEVRFVSYDFEAREVELDDALAEQGFGAQMSVGYAYCAKLVAAAEGEVLVVHFSDGDSWSDEDTAAAMDALEAGIVPRVKGFVYGQFLTETGEGPHLAELERRRRLAACRARASGARRRGSASPEPADRAEIAASVPERRARSLSKQLHAAILRATLGRGVGRRGILRALTRRRQTRRRNATCGEGIANTPGAHQCQLFGLGRVGMAGDFELDFPVMSEHPGDLVERRGAAGAQAGPAAVEVEARVELDLGRRQHFRRRALRATRTE
jgi:hypothetical protein